MKRSISVASFILMALFSSPYMGCDKASPVADNTANNSGSITGRPLAPSLSAVLPSIPVPQNLKVSVQGHSVTASWDAVPNAISYNVGLSGDAPEIISPAVSGTTVTIPDVPNGTYSAAVWVGSYTGVTGAGPSSERFPFTVNVSVASNSLKMWRPPVSLAGKVFKSGSTLPVKFIVVDAKGMPVTSGLNIMVTVGSASAAAALDDGKSGQWNAEIRLVGTGTQSVSLSGDIMPASMLISVR
jgi:hypothetical protein